MEGRYIVSRPSMKRVIDGRVNNSKSIDQSYKSDRFLTITGIALR